MMKKRRQHREQTRPAPPGSMTTACTEGQTRNVRGLHEVGPTIRSWARADEQGLRAKFAATPRAEVRCLHSSEEAE